MELERFLVESVSLLAAGVATVLVCSRLRVPPVVGLLLAGMAVGPSGLALVPLRAEVEIFAEIGVVLLLFAIGIELSLGQLRDLRRPFLLGGPVQVLLTIVAVTLIATVFRPLPSALFLGFVISLSSTAVVLKLYADRRETGTPQGQAALGILLFQDFLIVPMIVVTPVLAGAAEASTAALAVRFGGALTAIFLVYLAARHLVPRALHLLVGTRVREVFVLGALALCLAMAWLTHELGFSLALGAFLAGLLVSESEYSHQVIADIGPFRDVFASLFFISIGMLLDLRFAVAQLPIVVAIAVAVVVFKAVAAGLAVKLVGYPIRIAAMSGIALAQMGEFSFVLMEVGREYGLLEGDRFQLVLGAAVLSLLVTPMLIAWAPRLGERLANLAPRRERMSSTEPEREISGHVVVVGYGLNGRLLTGVLEETGIPHIVVEINAETARRATREGSQAIYGDVTRGEILEQAGILRAKAIVFAISDPWATSRAVRMARSLNPGLEIIVRTRQLGEIDALREAGASHVVAEEFESAIEIFTHVMERYHVPRNVIRAQTRVLRGEGYRMLRTPAIGQAASEAILEALAAGTTDIYQIAAGSAGDGQSLRSLDLRRHTGASVIAVVRGERSTPNPPAEMVLESGDCLVLVGSHEEIDRAFSLLQSDAASG